MNALDETPARANAELQLLHAAHLAGVGAWHYEVGPPARLHWSEQTARIHERAGSHRVTLKEAFEHYPPEAQALLVPAFERALRDGSRFELELPMHTASGRLIWVQALGEGVIEQGRVVRLLGAFREVTQQREREQALELLVRRQRALYEESPALLLALDTQGRVQAASSALLRRLGRTREELARGVQLADWCTPQSAQDLSQQLLPLLFDHGRVERLLLTLTAEDDTLVELLISATKETPELAQAVLEDVTEQRLAAREVQREQALRLQLQAHARDLRQLLDERSDMLGVLAHEVRQPLNNASAALQGAMAALAEGSAEAQAVHRAQRVLGQVQADVDNNLAAAELLGGRGEPVIGDVELDLLLGIALGDLSPPERERVALQLEAGTRTVRAELGLFRLALRNLLLNALAWSPSGAMVRLRVLDSDEPLGVCVDVIDAGPGIDAALLPRLFQRGARGRASAGRRSHGLGLYIARAAMERMHGQALLLSTGPSGTAMRLQLPI
ncbi:MAG: PAS domain-containing protein [Burkholderiales bacterium]|nr:PAS domain-containing protein [Burkholderiales bacterium]